MKRSATITIPQLKKSAVWEKNKHLFEPARKKDVSGSRIGGIIISKVYPQKSREKMSIEASLFEFCQVRGIVLYGEYRFAEERAWRLDYFFEFQGKRYGVEYEGIISDKSRHTGIKGYSGDTDKYRAAALAGIIIMRYTALNYGSLKEDLETF
ncbi:MAG: hypothetical protein J7599_07555 [Niabella sp.]|nr:hypothetical protein [Niabella sp.]